MDILDELEKVAEVDGVGGIAEKTRKTRIVDLIEGDILVQGDIYQRVASGEVSIGADGTIDTSNGELVPVSVEAIALGFTGTIFNMEDI